MPTSSIFTSIIIDTSEKAEKFINALEKSSRDPDGSQQHPLKRHQLILKKFAR